MTAALEAQVLRKEVADYVLQGFEEQLKKRLAEMQKKAGSFGSELETLSQEREELQGKARKLTEAIATVGQSPSLLSHLAALDMEVAQVDRRIAAHRPVDIKANLKEAREFARTSLMQLRALLKEDASAARMALQKHLRQLVLTPETAPTGPEFAVTGSVNLGGTENDVMQVVARDGIEPPTPAFSGLRSTN